MRGPLARFLLALALGVVLAGGIVGIAIDLSDAQSRSRTDVKRSAAERPALAASLIDSIFSASYTGAADVNAPISGAVVTRAEVRAVIGDTPLAAVLDRHGRILATTTPISAALAARITADAAVRSVLAGHSVALSSLITAAQPLPPGFLDVSAYTTPFGRRIQLSWFPLQGVTATLQQYLRYVAHFSSARVYLIDGADTVIGSSNVSDRLAIPLADGPLKAALGHSAQSGLLRDGAVFFAAASLHVAPWRVVYTVPTSVLYGSTGYKPLLSFLLLAGFGMAAGICVLLLARLASRSAELSRANVALAQRNIEVEQASQAKTRFLANMSHELRTPLNAIIGFAELLDDERLGPITREHREYLGDIRSSAQHLLHLINEMLDLARIESGRIMLDVQEVNPLEVAAECVDATRSLANENGVSVTLEGSPIGPVMLDPARLRQVLLNYLSNAIKFTPPRGSVKVRIHPDDDELLIEVADTGLGIDPADQERVFGEFEQLANAPAAGTGLGLAVTKRIVEAQRGTVGVRSVPGQGSTFFARLPINRPPMTETPAPPPSIDRLTAGAGDTA